ncbi:tyrosine-protein phosphatase non-receptor type 9 isoform X4 [Ostrinia furnacalis]|uniref:tyrosine-protein phosphatase non-receptor type 9 isoform X4 n=1 Tax=Ostrinia furnacalis TaxID=93504 RepID=UPI00103E9CEB|nr:tyrosine-protein phosphatase non-receptor type 9 isoform X4 [Ostrinia furnacalis]
MEFMDEDFLLNMERAFMRNWLRLLRATKAFLDALSESGATCVSRATAIKFLFARKFDVLRAHTLWRQHEATRRREGLNKFEPFEEPLKSELETGKFTILPTRDATGAAIAVFTANKHFPSLTTHQTTLQGVVYQLDVALTSIETQRAGLVFIYDMTDSKYTNFDYELSQKILTLLKGGYPAKLKKVLIVTAPLWFKAPFRILRLFVREKLRERVHTVSAPQLGVHVPRASLPRQLGGQLEPDHAAWLEHCKNCYTNNLQNSKLDGIIDEYVISNHIPAVKPQNGIIEHEVGCDMTSDRAARLCDNNTDMHISGDPPYTCDTSPLRNTHGYNGDMKGRHINSGDEDDLDISTRGTWSSGEASPGLSDEECGGGAGETPAALLARVRSLRRRGLAAEYEEIRARPPCGTFHHAKLPSNLAKNRYTDVLCYDHSRVTLSQTDPDDPSSDYINANYVDGYKQKNAFICTQGPLPKTFGDFWRMVWEQGTLVIVMTTRAIERGRVKCGQYWPLTVGQRVTHAGYSITNELVETDPDYTITHLVLTELRTEQTRRIWHGQYTRWPDYGVPGGGRAQPVLRFLTRVRRAQQRARADLGDAWAGHSRGPPIVVHCSAGIGRTGTFITLDICTLRLAAEGAVDVRGTVERVRAQRAHSIQMPDQYVFCHLAVLEHAVRLAMCSQRGHCARHRGARAGAARAQHPDARPVMNGYLESADLTGFDDDNEEESE